MMAKNNARELFGCNKKFGVYHRCKTRKYRSKPKRDSLQRILF